MQGRIENKIRTEKELQYKLNSLPNYLKEFYYSLNEKSHTTKGRYINNVIRFLNNYSNNDINSVDLFQLSNINSFDVEKYISDINYFERNNEQKELSPASKACIYSSINAFFIFLKSNDYIKRNPFDNGKIQRPKIQENDVVFLTPDEVKAVEDNILHGCGTDLAISRQIDWKYRDYLLFRIPVVCGLRVKALSEINIEDINFDDESIRVTEKGNITKNIYLDTKTFNYIRKWLSDRRELVDNDCKALFISNRKQRITVRSIEDIISKYTENVTKKHITPHKLRSTCGTNLYQAKKDIYLVASVLGHKSTAPTRRYTKVFEEDKRAAVRAVASLY